MDEKLTRQKVYAEKEETEEYYNQNREPLSIDITKEVTVLLSWGGPSDGFKLMFDKDNELLSGVYFIANWGEYEEVILNDEELDKVYNFYLYGDNSFLNQ
jgi:hypothetical protein